MASVRILIDIRMNKIMKYKNGMFFSLLFLIIFFGCVSMDLPLFPYDPEKAGAEIIESYDLSEFIKGYDVHFCANENLFYIAHKNKIFIFDKENLTYQKTITNNIYSLYSGNYEIRSFDITVIKDKILSSVYLFPFEEKGKYINVISDLSGDNLIEVDSSSDIGNISGIFGYNYDKDCLWSFTAEYITNNSYKSYKMYINEYKFDELSGNYFFNLKYDYPYDMARDEIFMNGTTLVGYQYSEEPYVSEIEIRDVNNYEKDLLKINIFYLNTNKWVEDLIYDDDYLWIIVEKDDKMQLLKI